MQLRDGSRVVIVGGGPAGSFAALHLLRFAGAAGLALNVQIVEPRDFDRPGPGGCNKCAGILSSPLLQGLRTLGLRLPAEVIQAEPTAYILHAASEQIAIPQPNPERGIVSVYRGGGPRAGQVPRPPAFDGWLLREAQNRGAVVERARVRAIRPGPRPVVETASGVLEPDLVVVATGVNSRSPLDPAWGYRPPRTRVMAQDELAVPNDCPECVHVFFQHPPGIIFGALVPKGRYTNVSLLGRKLPPGALDEFLRVSAPAAGLPAQAQRLCGCTPSIGVSPARGYYANRMVVVGDAAVTRLYKDGIGAAFHTAEGAARAAVQHGLSRAAFAAGYGPVCRALAVDNLYGRLLFRLWDFVRATPRLMNVWQRALLAEASQPLARRAHTRVLWAMFTGDEPYRQILGRALSGPALRGLWRGVRGR